GRVLLPNKYGDNGWYGYTPNQHTDVQRDIYLFTFDPADRRHLAADPWFQFLDGKNPSYPEKQFEAAHDRLRRRLESMRADKNTPDTRPSDGAQRYSPIETETLVNLMLGANDPGRSGNILHAPIRYFDPLRRRAGLPGDVAALVTNIAADRITVTLVNTNPTAARDVIIQSGAYAEHRFTSLKTPTASTTLDTTSIRFRLAPGAGAPITLGLKRLVNQPTAKHPWD
ncbi:MAG: hypothetical protein JNK48_06645, partial [Bryobacterales bacterium]|nr:hypothetical protein [Bryobacterales bacterium]